MEINCYVCKKEFSKPQRIIKTRNYCSRNCMGIDYTKRWSGENNPNFKNARNNCCNCGKKNKSYVKKTKYCSVKCYFDFKRKSRPVKIIKLKIIKEKRPKKCPSRKIYYHNCVICKSLFVCQHNYKRLCGNIECKKISQQKTSQKAAITQRHNIFIKCKICKKDFRISKSQKNKKYCSFKCRKVDLSGIGNPNYIDGSTPLNMRLRNTLKYKRWRKKVFKRDNYTCQKCGKKSIELKNGTLHADHIKPFSYFPELRFDISNGRALCIDCHKKTDTYLSGAIKNKQNYGLLF